jgi:hypothetical protein
MQLSTTREATSCVAIQQFPSVLRNTKIHHRIPLLPIRATCPENLILFELIILFLIC